MPNFDESVINFAVYEDGVEYVGMAGVTLPNLSAIVQTLSGAGIAGNVDISHAYKDYPAIIARAGLTQLRG